MQISIQEFQSNLANYLKHIGSGEEILLLQEGKPFASITPVEKKREPTLETGKKLALLKGVKWNGKKPKGGKLFPQNRGRPVSELVSEDRR